MSQQPCLLDTQCPGSEICMTNATWYTGPASGCICSTWYGFEGLGCTGTNTVTSNFWMGSAIVLCILAIWGAGLAFFNAWRLYRAAHVGFSEPTSAANLQLLVTFVFMFIWEVLTAVEAKDPSLSTQAPSVTAQKIASTKLVREVFTILAVLFVINAAMTIALVWIEVAERARRMTHKASASVIPGTRKLVIGFEVILAICMVAAIGANYASVAIVFGLIAVIFVAVFYMVGYFKLIGELRAVSSVAAENNKAMYRTVINEIQVIALGTAFWCVVLFAICVALAVLSFDDWKQSGQPGSVPPIVVVWQVLPLAIMGLAFTLLHGLRKATSRKLAPAKTSDMSNSNQGGKDNKGQNNTGGEKPAPLKTDQSANDVSNFGTAPLSPTAISAAYQVDDRA